MLKENHYTLERRRSLQVQEALKHCIEKMPLQYLYVVLHFKLGLPLCSSSLFPSSKQSDETNSDIRKAFWAANYRGENKTRFANAVKEMSLSKSYRKVEHKLACKEQSQVDVNERTMGMRALGTLPATVRVGLPLGLPLPEQIVLFSYLPYPTFYLQKVTSPLVPECWCPELVCTLLALSCHPSKLSKQIWDPS